MVRLQPAIGAQIQDAPLAEGCSAGSFSATMGPPPVPAPLSPLAAAGLQALAGLVGSAIGGVVVWLTAVRKLKGERAFDRRLEHYERMHGALIEALTAVHTIIHQYGRKELTAADATTSLGATMGAVQRARRSAILYANPAVVVQVETSFDKLRKETSGLNVPGDSKVSANMLMLLEELRSTLLEADLAVADEARGHMGLEKLDRGALTTVSMFQ